MNTRRRLLAPFMRNPGRSVILAFSILLIVGLLVERAKSGNPPSGTLSASQWTALGPGPIPVPGFPSFAGRIDVAAPDPTNSNVMYLGSNNGGIWKTTNWLDASPTWTVITDQPQILSLAIHEHDLVVFPGNPNIVLAAASGPGGGILRSEDGGNTWSFFANSKFDLVEFGALVVDPNVANAQTLYVAISGAGGSPNLLFGAGLYISVDGGATWNPTGAGTFSGFVNDVMQIQENGKTVLYAADAGSGNATSGGIFRKVDNGPWQTTNFLTNPNFHYADIRLAGGTTPTEFIYASAIDNAGVVTRYSWDTVGSWSPLTWPNASGGGFHRVHHNVLAVDPANSKNVYVNTDVENNLFNGGPQEWIYLSPDGGKTWNAAATGGGDPVSGSFDSTGKFISTGDAGIFRDPVNDGTSSAVKGSNLNTIEFYSFSLDPSNPRTAYGLFQDGPGILKYVGGLNWLYKQPPAEGESGKVRVDATNPNRVYWLDPNCDPIRCAASPGSPGSLGRLLRSNDGGKTWTAAGVSGLPVILKNGVAFTDYASFPGKGSLVIDPNNPKRLLVGLAEFTDVNNVTTPGSVFETTTGGDPNPTDPNFNGNGWRNLGQNIGNNVSTISKIAVAPSDPNTIFVGDEDGRIFKTTTAGDKSPSWNPVDNGLPIFQDMRIMDLQINPANPDYDFAVISHFMGRDDKPNFNGFPHVWVRNGGGWSPINGNLPNELGGETLAVDWQPTTPVLYLGTLRGAFKSTDLGTTWTLFDSMPRTRVSDLDFMPNLHLLAAGTIGRGAWEILTQSTPPSVMPPANQASIEAASQSLNLGSFSDPDGGPWTVDVDWGDGSPHASFSAASPGSLAANNHTYQEQGPYTVTIAVTDTLDGQSDSKTFSVNVSDPPVNASGGFTFQANVGTSTGSQSVATFTDPAGAEPNASDSTPTTIAGHYTASIDWGDGTKSTGAITPLTPTTPSQQFTVMGNHTYATESPASGFNLITTINHEGVTSNASSTAIVGRAGLVSGGGNIGDSRSFSFVAQPNITSFKGNLSYQDTINNINVQSTSLTFVSILSDNVHATISGTAMVNGTSGYTFRVDVEDNGVPGIGVDRFRIRLSGPASYDSNAFAANGGLLTGGIIRVH